MSYGFSFKKSLQILAFASVFSISMPAFSLFNVGIEGTGGGGLSFNDHVANNQKYSSDSAAFQWEAAFFIEHDVLPFLPNYQFSYSMTDSLPNPLPTDGLSTSDMSHLFYYDLIKSAFFRVTSGFDYQILSISNDQTSVKDNAAALQLGLDLLLPIIQPSFNISIPLSQNIRKTSADARISMTVLPLLVVKGELMLGYRYDYYDINMKTLSGNISNHLAYVGATLTLGL